MFDLQNSPDNKFHGVVLLTILVPSIKLTSVLVLFSCYFRPIFIVNTVLGSECDNDEMSGINETDSSPISQRADMEINNNNSLYLQRKCEDKGDNNDKRVQPENNIIQVVTTTRSRFSREKIVRNSLKEMIEVQAMNAQNNEAAFSSDSDQSHNETMTQLEDKILKAPEEITENFVNENAENSIKNEMIKSDSERLEAAKCVEDVTQPAIATTDSSTNELKIKMTQSIGESRFTYFCLICFIIGNCDNFLSKLNRNRCDIIRQLKICFRKPSLSWEPKPTFKASFLLINK